MPAACAAGSRRPQSGSWARLLQNASRLDRQKAGDDLVHARAVSIRQGEHRRHAKAFRLFRHSHRPAQRVADEDVLAWRGREQLGYSPKKTRLKIVELTPRPQACEIVSGSKRRTGQGLPEILPLQATSWPWSFCSASRLYQELKAPVPREARPKPRAERSQLSGTVWSHLAPGGWPQALPDRCSSAGGLFGRATPKQAHFMGIKGACVVRGGGLHIFQMQWAGRVLSRS
jgi:hypothetical protein